MKTKKAEKRRPGRPSAPRGPVDGMGQPAQDPLLKWGTLVPDIECSHCHGPMAEQTRMQSSVPDSRTPGQMVTIEFTPRRCAKPAKTVRTFDGETVSSPCLQIIRWNPRMLESQPEPVLPAKPFEAVEPEPTVAEKTETVMPGAMCRCGCGETLTGSRKGGRVFVDKSHRVAHYAKSSEVTRDPLCACGCGEEITGPRINGRKYLPEHSQRGARKNYLESQKALRAERKEQKPVQAVATAESILRSVSDEGLSTLGYWIALVTDPRVKAFLDLPLAVQDALRALHQNADNADLFVENNSTSEEANT